ncbi:MAG TPA: F0F1 ATP synthase subunit alpha, partial [Candidatus Marinimicrobia bacterium]|nr:F0F1 ATP synthase subunit alpha [Candidatus Neomarinimicrobiota bacterium]
VEKQIAILFAGTRGYLDGIPLEKIQDFEKQFLDYLDASHSDLLKQIITDGKLTDAVEQGLTQSVTEFVKGFIA